MIRTSAILAIAWCATRLLKRRPAAERQLIWAIALATASLLPVLTLIVPAWRPEAAAKITAALPALSQASAVQQAQQAGGAIVHAVGIEPEGRTRFFLLAIWIGGTIVAVCGPLRRALRPRICIPASKTRDSPVLHHRSPIRACWTRKGSVD